MDAKKLPVRPLAILLVLVVLLSALVGSAVGKYIRTITFTGKVTFSAKLATDMVLQERQAQRQSDGGYELTDVVLPTEDADGNTISGNNYVLLPGLDIPKDPHVIVEGKTPVEAYLFIEVVDSTPNPALVYTIDNNWKELTGVTGKNNGTVYVYTAGGKTPAVLDENFTDTPVRILKDNKVEVKQGLNAAATQDSLVFYACMGETAMGADAEAVYKAINNLP